MTRDEFTFQMGRLIETYPNVYRRERTDLFWGRVAGLRVEQFRKIVDELIGECKYAPLLPELEAKLSILRERDWSQDKKEHARDAKAFFSSYQNDDVKFLGSTIRKRMLGQVNDADWAAFQETMESVARLSGGKR